MFSFLLLTLALAIDGGSASNALRIDCSEDTNKTSAECICRLPKNWNEEICQGPEWFGNSEYKPNIINGEEVGPNVYPWFARATNNGSWDGCGGSLVTPEYVLTAAHCVYKSIKDLKKNGGYQIGALCAPYGPSKTKNCNQKVESFGIREITQHPNYNHDSVNNDFALVRLDGVSTIDPVQMDNGNISPGYENMSSKTNLWPIGFGKTENKERSRKLLHVNVNYVKQNTCNSDAMYDGDITDSMMCAADTNEDACEGDSGGPLFDSDNNALVGVVSWGIGCARRKFPGVYARISDEFPWIKEVICASHGNPKPSFCGDSPSPPSPSPPSPSPCPAGMQLFEVEVKSDNFGSEDNLFKVFQKKRGGGFKNVWREDVTVNDSIQTFEKCLSATKCYRFVIIDRESDGLCCEYGDGGYKLTWGGEVIKESKFLNGERKKTKFNC